MLFSRFFAQAGGAEADGSVHGGHGGKKPVLWQVLRHAEDVAEYKQRGCLELGFASAFKSKAAADKAAVGPDVPAYLEKTAGVVDPKKDMSKAATLLKLRVEPDDFVDLTVFSVRGEAECFFPPCSAMDFKAESTVSSTFEGVAAEVPLRVLDVALQTNPNQTSS